MKKILVPTDYSDLSEYALNLANVIAKHTKAQIYALKVLSVPGEALFDKKGEVIDSGTFDISALEAEKEENIHRIKMWSKKSDLPVQIAVRMGHLQDQILHFIDQEQIDLVVMGTHGASGIKELIVGSVSARLVRDASVPVLTLKCDRSDLAINDIILASNFDHIGPGKLEVIKELQQAFGAKLHLLRVNTPADFVTTRKLLKQMEDFVNENELEDTEFSVYCAEDVADGITNFAEDYDIDLIAIGTQGRGTISRTIKKSVSKRLVNRVSHPILTFEI